LRGKYFCLLAADLTDFGSDIVAELEVPQSGILTLESTMPWPDLSLAVKNGEITEEESSYYFMQVLYRKKLNVIHRELYSPGKESSKLYSPTSNFATNNPYFL
jgi:hypothetical protein